jgi:acyl-CoA hydrolase
MSGVKSKRVLESAVHDQTYKIFPNDLNSNDTVFGGLVMSILDRVACVVAERHAERVCVTVSVDSMHFLAPARKGDVLIFQASINRSWRSSMEIGVRVSTEHHRLKNRKHILSAYLTFVALDKEGKPTEVPQVIIETPAEERRYREAELRRTHRQLEKEARLKARES